ncbi:hypothetical protein MMC20_001148 [Loxospora ochrophaea]|nr:hypothetical protein [Loxospora ochrophaea]
MSSTSASEFYDSLGMRYEQAYGHCPDLHAFIDEALNFVPPYASILDVGCGTGKPTASMVVASGRKLHGIDFSSKMVSLSCQQVPGGSFEQADILSYQPQSPFDAVVAIFSLLNFSHAQMTSIIAGFHNWIKPRSYLFIGTLHPDRYPPGQDESNMVNKDGTRHVRNRFMGHEANILLYTEHGWKLLLEKAGFEIITTSKAFFEPPPEAGCDTELHYYLIARRQERISLESDKKSSE